jgi:hypothetical protein
MAGYVFAETGSGATDVIDDEQTTSALSEPPRRSKDGRRVSRPDWLDDSPAAAKSAPITEPKTEEKELGTTAKQKSGASVPDESELLDRILARARRSTNRGERARGLIRAATAAANSFGQPSMAVHLQKLKKLMADVHTEFDGFSGEASFISVVSLAESALASTSWRDYSEDLIRKIANAFSVAYEKQAVSFQDYESIRHQFLSSGIQTVPTIDLEGLSEDDLGEGDDDIDDQGEEPE